MRRIMILPFFLLLTMPLFAQNEAQQIYETERAFEKMVADKGINAAFIEFLAPVSVIFSPGAVDGRERWKARAKSPAALTWNPILIDVSSNGALAYSIGNSIYRPNGNDDPNMFYGHYLSIWSRQGDGSYRAVLDTGINHEKPAFIPTDWKSPINIGAKNSKNQIAGDAATGFYETAEKVSLIKAYKTYLAEDAILLRNEKEPVRGKKAAVDFLNSQKSEIKFAKLKSFIETNDLAYVNSSYSITDNIGKVTENGNFVQVWKFTGGKWHIVADVFAPMPAK
ncbi:MAG: nuclear transport factor 2 family protein [Pyrinomonadaceae bacterium]